MQVETMPGEKVVEIETAAELCNLILPEGVRVVTDANGRLKEFASTFGARSETEMTFETGGEFIRIKIKGS
jgi:hypothetical protein